MRQSTLNCPSTSYTTQKKWLIINVPTSKNYEETWYDAIDKKIETTPNPYDNIVTWVEFLEKVCEEPEGERSLCELEPANTSVREDAVAKRAPPG